MGTIQNLLQMQAQRQRMAMTDEAVADQRGMRQRAGMDQGLLQQVFQETGGDWDQAVTRLDQIGRPDLSVPLREQIAKTRKERATALKTELDNDAGKIAAAAKLGQAITDDGTHRLIYGMLKQTDPQMADLLGETYDPARVQNLVSLGLSTKEALEERSKAVELFSAGKVEQGLARWLATATSADDWDRSLAGAKELGVPAPILQQFGAFSPEGVAKAKARWDAEAGYTLTPGAQRRGAMGDVLAEGPRAPVAPKDPTSEPLVAIMGTDGTPVLVPRSQAAGQRPASTREQGRAVTSGDAGRIADLETSLDDLRVLAETIAPLDAKTGKPKQGVTGFSAQLQAAAPAVVTDLTGYGIEGKQKQATIDRVKQVIGKALEGGVLRKEDEYKYERILPTIKDTGEVVRAKLDGLQKALQQRRSTLLESLGDAGYDVSRFQARTGRMGGQKVGRFVVEVEEP
jgi:hypothetical protein